MGLDLDQPCESWAVVRHHIAHSTLTALSSKDLREALTEAIAQYDQQHHKCRSQSGRIASLDTDLKESLGKNSKKMDDSVDNAMKISEEIHDLTRELQELRQKSREENEMNNMLEEALIAKDLDIEAANERLETLKAELAAVEKKQSDHAALSTRSSANVDVWITRVRESRALLLKQNHQLVEMEKKCARQVGEVMQAQLKIDAVIQERDQALAELSMLRETVQMDVGCLEDAVAATLLEKEEALLSATKACQAAEKREFEMKITLDAVTNTAVAVQEQLDVYNKLVKSLGTGPQGQIEALTAQLKTAGRQREEVNEQLRVLKEQNSNEVEGLHTKISELRAETARLQSELDQKGELQQWLDDLGAEREASEENAKTVGELTKSEQMKEKIALIAEARRVTETRMDLLEQSLNERYQQRSELSSDIALLSSEKAEGQGQCVDGEGIRVSEENVAVRNSNKMLAKMLQKMAVALKDKQEVICKHEASIVTLQKAQKDLEVSLHKAETTALRVQGEALAAEQAAKAHLAQLRSLEDAIQKGGSLPTKATADSADEGQLAGKKSEFEQPDADQPASGGGNAGLPSEIQRLNRVIQQLHAERDSNQVKLEGEIRSLRDSKLKKIVELEQELQAVEASWEADKHQFQMKVQNEREVMNKTVEAKHQEVRAAEVRTIAYQSQATEAAAKAAALQAKVEQLEDLATSNELVVLQATELQRVIAEQEDQIESLEFELSQMHMKTTALQAEVVDHKIASKEFSIEAVHLRVPEMQEQIKALTAERGTLLNDYSGASEKIAELKLELKSLSTAFQEKREEAARFKTSLEETQYHLNATEQKLHDTIEAIKRDNRQELDKLKREDALLINQVQADSSMVFEKLKAEVIKAQEEKAWEIQKLQVEREQMKRAQEEAEDAFERMCEEKNAALQEEIDNFEDFKHTEEMKLAQAKRDWEKAKAEEWKEFISAAAADTKLIYEESRLEIQAHAATKEVEMDELIDENEKLVTEQENIAKDLKELLAQTNTMHTKRVSGIEFAWVAFCVIRELQLGAISAMKQNLKYDIAVRTQQEAECLTSGYEQKLEAQAAEHSSQIADKDDSIKMLEAQIDDVEKRTQESLQQKDEQIERCKQEADERVEQFKSETADRIAKLEAQNAFLVQENATVQAQLGDQKSLARENDEELQQLRAAKEVADIINAPDANNDIVGELSTRIGTMQLENTRLTRLSEFKEDSIDTLQREVEKFADEADDLQDRLDAKDNELQGEKRNSEKLQGTIDELNKEIEELGITIKRRDKKISILQEEANTMSITIANYDKIKTGLRDMVAIEKPLLTESAIRVSDRQKAAEDEVEDATNRQEESLTAGAETADTGQREEMVLFEAVAAKVGCLEVLNVELNKSSQELKTSNDRLKREHDAAVTEAEAARKECLRLQAIDYAEQQLLQFGNTYDVVQKFRKEVEEATKTAPSINVAVDLQKMSELLDRIAPNRMFALEASEGTSEEDTQNKLDPDTEKVLIDIGTRLRVKVPLFLAVQQCQLEDDNYESLKKLNKLARVADNLQAKILEDDADAEMFADLLPEAPERPEELMALLADKEQNDLLQQQAQQLERENLALLKSTQALEKELEKSRKAEQKTKNLAESMDQYNQKVMAKQKELTQENQKLLIGAAGDVGLLVATLREQMSNLEYEEYTLRTSLADMKAELSRKEAECAGLQHQVEGMGTRERSFLVGEGLMWRQLVKDVNKITEENSKKLKIAKQTAEMERRVAALNEGIASLKLPRDMKEFITELEEAAMDEQYDLVKKFNDGFTETLDSRQKLFNLTPQVQAALKAMKGLPSGLNYLKFDAIEKLEEGLVGLGIEDDTHHERVINSIEDQLNKKDPNVERAINMLDELPMAVAGESTPEEVAHVLEFAPTVRDYLRSLPAEHSELRREAIDLLDNYLKLLQGKRKKMDFEEIIRRLQDAGRNEDSSTLESAEDIIAEGVAYRKRWQDGLLVGLDAKESVRQIPSSHRATRKGGLRILNNLLATIMDPKMAADELTVDAMVALLESTGQAEAAATVQQMITTAAQAEKRQATVEDIDANIAAAYELMLAINKGDSNSEVFVRGGPAVIDLLIGRLEAARSSAITRIEFEAEKRVEMLEQSVQPLHSQIASLEDKLQQAGKDLESKEAVIKEKAKEAEEMQLHIFDLKSELQKTRTLMSEFKQIDELKADNKRLGEDIVRLTARRATSSKVDLDMPDEDERVLGSSSSSFLDNSVGKASFVGNAVSKSDCKAVPTLNESQALVVVELEEEEGSWLSQQECSTLDKHLASRVMMDLEEQLALSRAETVKARKEVDVVYAELVEQSATADVLENAFRQLETQLIQSMVDVKSTQKQLGKVVSENKRLKDDLELNSAGSKALAEAQNQVTKSQILVMDAKVSNVAERSLLHSEVKKLRRQLHTACMKFRVDRSTFEQRETDSQNKMVAYQEDFSRRVHDLEGCIDILEKHLEDTVTTANLDRLAYDENIALMSERVQTVRDEYEMQIKQYEHLASEMENRESQLVKKIKETETRMTTALKKKEAQLKSEAAKERENLMRHINILVEQLEMVENATQTALQVATQQKIESCSTIKAKDMEIQALKDMRTAMEAQVDDLEGMIEHMREQVFNIANLVDTTEQKRLQLEKDKEHHIRRIADLEAFLGECKMKAAKTINSLLDRGRKEHDVVVALRQELQENKEKHAETQQAMLESTTAYEQSKNEVAELSLLHHKIAEQQAEIKKLKATINGLNIEVQSWQLSTEKAKVEAKTARAEKAALVADYERAEKKRNDSPTVQRDSTHDTPVIENGENSPQLSDIDSDIDLDLGFDIEISAADLDLDKPLSDLDMDD